LTGTTFPNQRRRVPMPAPSPRSSTSVCEATPESRRGQTGPCTHRSRKVPTLHLVLGPATTRRSRRRQRGGMEEPGPLRNRTPQ
jgi:hypothetical protein